MDFTFGICATKENNKFHKEIIDSIVSQGIPNFEIIFVGENCPDHSNVKLIYFEESIREGWITKKKNLIAEFASYDNVVFLHDYIQLMPDWYDGFLKFGNDFQVCMNVVQNLDSQRNIDWLICYEDMRFPNGEQLLPYDMEFTKMMYIPGFYWVAKKQFMLEHPLNEQLLWGMAEDIEWSRRIRNNIVFKMNSFSTVKFMKQKEYVLNEITPLNIYKLNNYYETCFK